MPLRRTAAMRASPLLPLALGCLRLGALAEALAAEEACEDAELTRTDLLQVGLSRSTPAARERAATEGALSGEGLPASRAQSLKPAYWMHVSSSGSTFASVLLNNPSLCPGFVGKGSTGLLNDELSDDEYRFMMASPTYNTVIRSACPAAFQRGILGSHDGLAAMADHGRQGHGLVMVRQPEQRLMSSFKNNQHDWLPFLAPAVSAAEYAHAVAGCTVKMLTRSGKDVCQNQTAPLDREVTEAVLRLESDFAFVGLTEEWNLSVCLFHAMFGGVVAKAELRKRGHSRSQYNTSDLKGFTDRFDGPVYEKATQLFHRNVQLYGLSEDSCASILGQ